ncbi:hypothetical protein IQ230_00045 [Gloeocapsopsis crepidinum LEGE 06123]|uniref:Uncharacterized protein n=1 Tax=Gloeocapsopsis crepidinum LEGE 06123 TaxID=588587 RepID=A0ABR9UKG1_9CHRO|nr:hypothetical protein [Gloeocapsopsis crepidinum]MBE9188782.1 hypothetical protein [Gloeocapsopsis crepidinum LEGE 06123]
MNSLQENREAIAFGNNHLFWYCDVKAEANCIAPFGYSYAGLLRRTSNTVLF